MKNNIPTNQEFLRSYLQELFEKAEQNERTLKDYIENYEGEEGDMTPEEQYEYDTNQRKTDLYKSLNIINNIILIKGQTHPKQSFYTDNEGTRILIIGDKEEFLIKNKRLEKLYCEKGFNFHNFYQELEEKLSKDVNFIILSSTKGN